MPESLILLTLIPQREKQKGKKRASIGSRNPEGYICVHVVIVAQLIIAKVLRQYIHQQMLDTHTHTHTHKMEYHSALRRRNSGKVMAQLLRALTALAEVLSSTHTQITDYNCL
jgi:hypothetical protein